MKDGLHIEALIACGGVVDICVRLVLRPSIANGWVVVMKECIRSGFESREMGDDVLRVGNSLLLYEVGVRKEIQGLNPTAYQPTSNRVNLTMGANNRFLGDKNNLSTRPN
jgi:hypothetical protein